jgi:hypothetical protein
MMQIVRPDCFRPGYRPAISATGFGASLGLGPIMVRLGTDRSARGGAASGRYDKSPRLPWNQRSVLTMTTGNPLVASMFALTLATSMCQPVCQQAPGVVRQRTMPQDGVTVMSMTAITATNSANPISRVILVRRFLEREVSQAATFSGP